MLWKSIFKKNIYIYRSITRAQSPVDEKTHTRARCFQHAQPCFLMIYKALVCAVHIALTTSTSPVPDTDLQAYCQTWVSCLHPHVRTHTHRRARYAQRRTHASTQTHTHTYARMHIHIQQICTSFGCLCKKNMHTYSANMEGFWVSLHEKQQCVYCFPFKELATNRRDDMI